MNSSTQGTGLQERVARLEGDMGRLYRLIGLMQADGHAPAWPRTAQPPPDAPLVGRPVSATRNLNPPAPTDATRPLPGSSAYNPAPTLSVPGTTTMPGQLPQHDHAASAPHAAPAFEFDMVRAGEFWLNKIGIGLLLFGVAFLFNYSIDQHWWLVTIGMGLAIGAMLLVLGLRMYEDRPHFSQVLLGGSVGTFYITGYAGYQVYQLPYFLVLAGMVTVTLLALGLAARQNALALSLIGTLGGLATPFVLPTGDHNLAGLVTYTSCVLAAALGIYFYRGWHALLWTAFGGGWAVLLAGVVGLNSLSWITAAALTDQAALQAGVVFAALLFAAGPVARELLWARRPDGRQHPTLDLSADVLRQDRHAQIDPHVHLAAILTPLLALAGTLGIWIMPKETWGGIFLAGTALYALAAAGLRRWDLRLAYTHALPAVFFFTLSLGTLLNGNMLLLALAVEATILHQLSTRLHDRGTAAGGHLLFAGLGLILLTRLAAGQPGQQDLFHLDALSNLAVIGLAFAAARILGPGNRAAVYRAAGHLAVFGWLTHELSGLPNGSGLLLLAGSAYAALLLVADRRLAGHQQQRDDLDHVVELVAGHVGFGLVGLGLLLGLVTPRLEGLPVLNLRGITDLAVIGLALGVSCVLRPREVAWGYRLGAYGVLLAWIWREVVLLPNGNAYVTIYWGACALGLLAGALPRRDRPLLAAGLGTVLLVVGKLFLIDLATLDAIWRILLFLGFGSGLLAFSYHIQSWLRQEPEPAPAPVSTGPAG